MSTDTRDALIARLEEIAATQRHSAAYLSGRSRVTSQGLADLCEDAARLLREDGERRCITCGASLAAVARRAGVSMDPRAIYCGPECDPREEPTSDLRPDAEAAFAAARAKRVRPVTPSRAALSALYLEAHRAGVEAAADHLRRAGGDRDRAAADYIWTVRDELASQARDHLADERNWTATGSALAPFSRAAENGNEAQGITTQVYRSAPNPRACPVCHGRGNVPYGFYSPFPTTSASTAPTETCRTCRGTTVYPPALAHPDAGSEARERVAEMIADSLFINGLGERARRLVLELEDGGDGGGWCREAVVARILAALRGEEVGNG